MDKKQSFPSRVWNLSPGKALFHKIEKVGSKLLAYEIECCNRKKSKSELALDVRDAQQLALTF